MVGPLEALQWSAGSDQARAQPDARFETARANHP